MPLLNKVRETIKEYRLIDKSDKILIGVSGGPDSVALLYALNSLKKELHLTLHIAHLNHMLRGKESQGDADFVVRLADRLGIPVTLREIKIAQLSKNRSLEETARKVRLDFLFEVARKIRADKVALGHNKDDQSETVLMRILRGSGLLGLGGILPKRRISGFIIIRPLIEIERADIEKFLKLKKIKPRRDSTNAQPLYFRNRIRLKLFPVLKKYNPNIKEVLANMAQSLETDYDYLLRSSTQAFSRLRIGKRKKQEIRMRHDKFLKLHPALQSMVLRLAFEGLNGNTRRLSYQHIKELKDLVYSRPRGSIVDLPSRISVCKNQRYLRVYAR